MQNDKKFLETINFIKSAFHIEITDISTKKFTQYLFDNIFLETLVSKKLINLKNIPK